MLTTVSLIMISMLINWDFEGVNIIVVIVLSFFIVSGIEMQEYYDAFRRVMRYVCILSLATYVLFTIAQTIMISFREAIPHSNIIFEVLSRFLYKCYPVYTEVNAAIFRERGVFAYYIIVDLVYILHRDKGVKSNDLFELAIISCALDRKSVV